MVTRKPRKTKPRTNKRENPLAPFMPRILESIIRPYILQVAGEGVSSKEGLWKAFRSLTGSNASIETFGGWLETLGIKVSTRTILEVAKTSTDRLDNDQNFESNGLDGEASHMSNGPIGDRRYGGIIQEQFVE